MKPQAVSDITIAFPAHVVGKLLPFWNEIPEEFREEQDQYSRHVYRWFYHGIDKRQWKPRDGIDPEIAWRHLQACMGSFEPKHEHKIAGVAWLMSQWFDLPEENKQ